MLLLYRYIIYIFKLLIFFWNRYFVLSSITEEQLDFPVLYASAKEGWASSTFTKDPASDARNMLQLLDAILKYVPPPTASLDAPFQMLVGSVFFFFLRKNWLIFKCLLSLKRIYQVFNYQAIIVERLTMRVNPYACSALAWIWKRCFSAPNWWYPTCLPVDHDLGRSIKSTMI